MIKISSKRFINRELSWLAFNRRVLGEALNPGLPLLERLKFLCIVSSNLDEFFMVRVGGLQMIVQNGLEYPDPAGWESQKALDAIRLQVQDMVRRQYHCLLKVIFPALARHGLHRLNTDTLAGADLRQAERFTRTELLPLVTPMAVEPDIAPPSLMPMRLHAVVRLAPARDGKQERYAVIPMPAGLERVVPIHARKEYRFMLAEDLLRHFIEQCFPGETVRECAMFRVTRNADIVLREDQSPDLLSGMKEILQKRKQSDCVRLEVEHTASNAALRFLQKLLQAEPAEIYRLQGPLQLQSLMKLVPLQGFDKLRVLPHPPMPQAGLEATKPMFETLARRSVLLHHPYEQFDPVVRFVEEASQDPSVLAIKQILYRVSRESPVVRALEAAALRGKQVTVLVELKARFDEERNIDWAKRLEQAGAQVIYGIRNLKTHAKLCLVIRREQGGIVRYMHFGTGNYNELTARQYTDISYMTCDETLGAEASEFFNAITGYSQPPAFAKLGAAPLGLKETLLGLIDGEAERRRQGDKKARITAKMNALVDKDIIEALYRASRAGVKIMLNVRGVCCLRPGVRGLSDNISVVSIVDRFLEHSRIFYFGHGGENRLFISSADWMPRNLERRIELMVPVEDPACHQRLMGILETMFRDTAKSHRLMSDGSYAPGGKDSRRKPFRVQTGFMEEARRNFEAMIKNRPTVFVPHRPAE